MHIGPHHLLHGKFSTLPKPYAVIRRAIVEDDKGDGVVEGDAEAEDDDEHDTTAEADENGEVSAGDGRATKRRKSDGNGRSPEGQARPSSFSGTLFEPDLESALFQTPAKPSRQMENRRRDERSGSSPTSSSFQPSSAIKDYSSELDFSSPPAYDLEEEDEDGGGYTEAKRPQDVDNADEDGDDKIDWGDSPSAALAGNAIRRAKKRKDKVSKRTRRYEVVGIVRKKVVFALR